LGERGPGTARTRAEALCRQDVRGFVHAAALLAVVVAPACLESGGSTTRKATTERPVWSIVALGDSDATGEGDATGLGWVERYARLVQHRFGDAIGVKVVVTNLARSGQTSAELLATIRSDPPTQGAVTQAQIVVIGIGGADMSAGDARLEAGTCKAEACYAADLFEFGGNIETTAGYIRQESNSPTKPILRAITLPNVVPGADDVLPSYITPEIGVYQSKALRRYICRAMAKHRGRCVDVLSAFNGREGTQDAYAKGWLTKSPCCYPSDEGQQVMAELVLKTGLDAPG
jgi:lysophospholipase L1-like esterase